MYNDGNKQAINKCWRRAQLSGKNLGSNWPLHISDLVTSISISEKHGKLVSSEKYLVALATPVTTLSSVEQVCSGIK